MDQESSTISDSSASSNGGSSPNSAVIILAVALGIAVIALVALIAILVLGDSSDSTDDIEAAPTATESVTTEQACLGAGGTFVSEHNECENIPAATCEEMGGTFDECGSPCRHMPADTMCTAQCVQVCSFGGGAADTAQPESVIAQLNNPLPCNLLEEPVVIGDVTATYGCQAPGAFLTEVDTSSEPWTAGYFTTDTQISEVTDGPEEVTVVPNPESP